MTNATASAKTTWKCCSTTHLEYTVPCLVVATVCYFRFVVGDDETGQDFLLQILYFCLILREANHLLSDGGKLDGNEAGLRVERVEEHIEETSKASTVWEAKYIYLSLLFLVL